MNELFYNFAVWLDSQTLSTSIHESYYMYNWIESTHVLTLMICLGMLFLIDLRMVGLAFTNVPATKLAHKLNLPMLIGFSIMVVTGVLLSLYYKPSPDQAFESVRLPRASKMQRSFARWVHTGVDKGLNVGRR